MFPYHPFFDHDKVILNSFYVELDWIAFGPRKRESANFMGWFHDWRFALERENYLFIHKNSWIDNFHAGIHDSLFQGKLIFTLLRIVMTVLPLHFFQNAKPLDTETVLMSGGLPSLCARPHYLLIVRWLIEKPVIKFLMANFSAASSRGLNLNDFPLYSFKRWLINS